MPQFNVNGPGSPAFILTSDKIEQALTYKPGKQEDVEALQNAVAKKAEKTDLDAYTTTKDLESKLEKKADLTKLDEYTTTKDLETKLNDKADKSDLEAKANASDLDNYVLTEKHEADLSKKADKTDLNKYTDTETLNDLLDAKANTTDIERDYATKEALAQVQAGTETSLAGYAKQSYVDDQLKLKAGADTVEELSENVTTLQGQVETKAENSAVQALTETVNGKADSKTVEEQFAKKSDIASAVRYKGSVQTLSDLQDKKETAQLGDLFNVVESDMNYVYNGSDFDTMAPMLDMSGYALKSYVDSTVAPKANTSDLEKKAEKDHTHQASEVTFADGEDIQAKLDAGYLGSSAIQYIVDKAAECSLSEENKALYGDILVYCPITEDNYKVGDICLVKEKNAIDTMGLFQTVLVPPYCLIECIKDGTGCSGKTTEMSTLTYFDCNKANPECALFKLLAPIGSLSPQIDIVGLAASGKSVLLKENENGKLDQAKDGTDYISPTTLKPELAKKADTVHTHQASEVTFSDGEDFQTKLDNGSLKGPKGDKGEPGQAGAAGKDGAAGAKGDTGPNLVDTTTSTSITGLLKGTGTNVAQAVDGTDYMSKTKADAAYLAKAGGEITGALTVDGAVTAKSSISATGNITGAYVTGTWLKTTDVTEQDAAPTKIATIDSQGWVYYRTFEHFKADLGINTAVEDYATKAILVTLTSSGWKDNTQTVTATGVIADENTQEIRVMPHTSSIMDYKDAGILCTAQAQDSLTFTCETQPEADIKVYINMEKVMWGGVIEPPKFTVTFKLQEGDAVYDTCEVEPGGTATSPKPEPQCPFGNTGENVFNGWNSQPNQQTPEAGVLENIQSSKTVYAAWRPNVL